MPWKTKKTPAPKKGTRKSSKKATDLDGSITQVLGDSVSNVLHDGQIPPISVTNSESSEGSAPLSVIPPTSAVPVDKSDAICNVWTSRTKPLPSVLWSWKRIDPPLQRLITPELVPQSLL